MNDPSALANATADLIDRVGVGGALIAIAVASLAIFLITLAKTAAKIIGETYTERATRTVWRWMADWLVALGAARTRQREVRLRIAEGALADLDSFETEDGQHGWMLVVQGIALAWSAPDTAAYVSSGAVSRYRLERTFSLLVAFMLIVLLLPVFAIVSVAIVITLGRPILFRQKRLGLNGDAFWMYKFRTFRPDSRLFKDPNYTGPERRTASRERPDPRFPPLGRLLRLLSLDELPMLLNVLRGDMTLVGPRPPIPELVNDQDSDHPRTRVRPGVTGLWQTEGDESDHKNAVDKLDELYVEERSFLLDLKILVRTPVALLRKSSRRRHRRR